MSARALKKKKKKMKDVKAYLFTENVVLLVGQVEQVAARAEKQLVSMSARALELSEQVRYTHRANAVRQRSDSHAEHTGNQGTTKKNVGAKSFFHFKTTKPSCKDETTQAPRAKAVEKGACK